MTTIQQYFRDLLQLDAGTVGRLITSLLVIFALLILKFVIVRIVTRRSDDARVRYNWRKSTTYVLFILGFLILGRTWLSGFASLTTYLGLVSAGLAIALRDPIVNLVAWAFIMWRRPFTVGDRIEIGTYRGDVIDLRIFQFTLMEIGNWVDADQSTGRVIRIPNGKVFTEMLANYSKGFRYIWNEIPVLITFESDWEAAKKLLFVIAERHAAHLTERAAQEVLEASARLMIFYTTLTPIVYTSVKDSGVLLTIRYLCAPRERRGTEQAVWEDVLREFATHEHIDLAYPTIRYYTQMQSTPDRSQNSETT